MESSIKINLQNEAGKSIGLYIINRVTVADAIRRNKLFDLVKTEDETARGQYFNAISLICSLCDEKGNLLYPEKDYPELTAVEEIFKMDFELYQVLSEAFLDINPIAPTLSAKKKEILGDGYLLLVKRICETLKKPVFEVMEYPETELQYWSAFFSINEGSQATNQAISLKQKQNSVTVEQSQNDLMRVLGNG